MARTEYEDILEKLPFRGLKVYFSGSIRGSPEPDPEFPRKLVQYMTTGGADVLSEHVAGSGLSQRSQSWGWEWK